ncbi:hypothetical protein HYH03_016102 [Edaphochlamys debaryana]|uniref:Uncharacterized protein n=1 Tax=Edaphochlamys debaryana TaxID=47281 RepID=A0A835XKK9_9CHLO|nr:hypothetical protein HYH03_016102 [Edaphochlamys debaryana]|eukprot:KAG2485115.1 hypothetical protein HYH03_016102 [Edaphochlamys debaryana]
MLQTNLTWRGTCGTARCSLVVSTRRTFNVSACRGAQSPSTDAALPTSCAPATATPEPVSAPVPGRAPAIGAARLAIAAWAAAASVLAVTGGVAGPAAAAEATLAEAGQAAALTAPAATAPPLAEADCPDGLCPGEVNGTLNACGLSAPSCVSTMADDAEHFAPPWSYADAVGAARGEDAREAAVAALVDVATGGLYEPGLSTALDVTNGYSRLDAFGYIVGEMAAAVTGGAPPERPQPRRDPAGAEPFEGHVVDRHTTADGDIYLRIRFSGGGAGGDGGLLDAEFIFPQDDSIALVRCAAAQPAAGSGEAAGGSGGGGEAPRARLALSFESGLTLDANTSRRQMYALRTALRWEVVPVIAEFDPKFNKSTPLWFERLYAPFADVR